MAIFITIEGTVNRQGRDRLPAKVWEKCELVTGSGAVILKAPRQLSLSSRNLIAFTISSIWIQERNCLPCPSLPPTPNLNGSAILASAPPFLASTTPVLNVQTRVLWPSTVLAIASHFAQSSCVNSLCGGVSSETAWLPLSP